MVRIIVKIENNEDKYITKTIIECRFCGILLYRKEYLYPQDGCHGEYSTH